MSTATAPRKRRPKQAVTPDRPGWLEYKIDGDGLLTAVSSRWNPFAAANGRPELTADSVLGADLWSFITDEATAQLYRGLVDRVRTSGKPCRFPLRCDSAKLRRELELTIVPLPDGGTAFRTWLMRVVPRTATPLLDPAAKRSELSLSICSWCKRVQLPKGEWLELEEACIRLRSLGEQHPPQLSHGACPNCLTQFK